MQVSHENYHRVKDRLDSYSDWDHYASLMPAKRLWSSLSQTVHEKIVVDESMTGKQILDKLYSTTASDESVRRAA